MFYKSLLFFTYISGCILSFCHAIIAGQQKITATIDINKTGELITEYNFGQLIENLGNVEVGDLVDDGLWAEC